jgi:hypothetical protein
VPHCYANGFEYDGATKDHPSTNGYSQVKVAIFFYRLFSGILKKFVGQILFRRFTAWISKQFSDPLLIKLNRSILLSNPWTKEDW